MFDQSQETIDLSFLKNLLDNGADVNFPDKHGQTILHEVARGWHQDVMKFVLENGGEHFIYLVGKSAESNQGL